MGVWRGQRREEQELIVARTDVTGPATATKAILIVFDVIGFSSNALQGADILSTSGPTEYLVVVPDYFGGNTMDVAWYPPQNDDDDRKMVDALQGHLPDEDAEMFPGFIEDVGKQYTNVKEWGVVGFSWGGHVVAVLARWTCGKKLKAAALCQPVSIINAEVVAKIKVPVCYLASVNDDVEAVRAFEEALKVESRVETFGDHIDGVSNPIIDNFRASPPE